MIGKTKKLNVSPMMHQRFSLHLSCVPALMQLNPIIVGSRVHDNTNTVTLHVVLHRLFPAQGVCQL